MLLFITNPDNMLSINQTMSSIVNRLNLKKKAYREIYEVSRTEKRLIIGASCIEFDKESLGRLIVKEVKSMYYQNKPKRIGFELDGSAYGTFCDPSEVLVVCHW